MKSATLPSLPPTSGADVALRAAHAAGRRAHPRLDLPYGAFVSRSVGAAPPLAAADYYLARACDADVPGAWEHLQREFRRRLLGFLKKRGARRAEADQILEEAWGAFAAPPASGGSRTTIGTYDGRGSLHAWMATILWRRLTERWRARTAEPRPPAPRPEAGVHARDPADRASDDETARLLGAALEEAWAELTPRELHAVVLKYRHQLPQTEIANTLDVGTPRVTRLLQSAAERLRASIELRLGPQVAWGAPGGGWGGLFEAVERILARAAVEIDNPPMRRAGHG